MPFVMCLIIDTSRSHPAVRSAPIFLTHAIGCVLKVCLYAGHLHDGVILLLRPEFFWVLFLYLNLVAPWGFK